MEGRSKRKVISRITTSWSLRFSRKFPFIADQLYSNGLPLTLFGGMVFLSIFFQLILYPGDSGTQGIINAFQFSPFYTLFSKGYDLSSIPYLGYVISQLFAFFPLIFLPYITYSFISMELRDINKTEELILSYPITRRMIFIGRSLSAIIEFLILILLIIVGLVIPELIIGKISYSFVEILVVLLSIPLYFNPSLSVNWIFFKCSDKIAWKKWCNFELHFSNFFVIFILRRFS
jgi:hypothetical protein